MALLWSELVVIWLDMVSTPFQEILLHAAAL